jgi:hypothetical protein
MGYQIKSNHAEPLSRWFWIVSPALGIRIVLAVAVALTLLRQWSL